MLAVNYNDSGSINGDKIGTRFSKSCTATIENGDEYTLYFGVIYSQYGEYDLLVDPIVIVEQPERVTVKVRHHSVA